MQKVSNLFNESQTDKGPVFDQQYVSAKRQIKEKRKGGLWVKRENKLNTGQQ